MTSHYSIDIETLGTKADSVILSVGVCQFSIETGAIGAVDYMKLNKELQLERSRDDSTCEWWNRQDFAVRAEAFSGTDSVEDLRGMLHDTIDKDGMVWGNGSSFDITLLDNLLEYNKLPWKYSNVRDMRTIVWLAEQLGDFDKRSVQRVGDHHNALDDAIYQASVISKAYNALKEQPAWKTL